MRSTSGSLERPAVADALGPEIGAADELPHDQQIDIGGEVEAQHTPPSQRGQQPDGPQVGIQVETLPEGEQPGLGPLVPRDRGILLAADGAEQDSVGRTSDLDEVGRIRSPGRPEGAEPDRHLLILQVGTDRLEHLPGGADDFGPDAVTGEEEHSFIHHGPRFSNHRPG